MPRSERAETPRARFDAGTTGQKALFVVMVALFVVGLVLTVADKLDRVGEPDVGFTIDSVYVSPTRDDASDAGLRGGGRVLAINGGELSPADARTEKLRLVDATPGAINVLRVLRPGATVPREIAIPVRNWTWHDALFTEGASDLIGVLIFGVGVTVFLLRPFEIPSWALLALAVTAGGTLITTFIPIHSGRNPVTSVYFRFLIGLTCFVPFHMALAFPLPHRLLLRGRGALALVYGAGVLQGVANLIAWQVDFVGPWAYVRVVSSAALFASMLMFVVRCVEHAFGRDPLVAQRARILLAGGLFGFTPIALTQFAQQVLGTLAIDPRFAQWALGIFVLALARVTLSHELLNARITVRRALIYAAVVGFLTVFAIALVSVRPYAVAGLLLPLLYVWPRFDAWLDRKLYPQRARFPELLRELGTEMATCASVDEVLDALGRAPARLCDARSSVSFVFAGVNDAREHVSSSDRIPVRGSTPIADEPLVLMLRTVRKEIVRERVALEPAYSNIKEDCYAGFERLRAVLLLPIVEDGRVVGGLAIGPRTTGDVYQDAEIDALSTVAQQAAQALLRVQATERLRSRELEFADLKRFFPPQIIDQVMARGGASELRSQRKLVTVVFADLRGFTSFSETHEPEEVTATLAEYHAAMGARIAEYAGTLEHFAGDGFMVFFNDPVDQPDHADRAVKMALAMCRDVRRLREGWSRKGYPIDAGIGIDAGYATVGFVGYEGRRDYGVIGNVTNLAARLSDAAAGGEILITARACAELRHPVPTESVGELALKGFAQPQATFRILQPG